MNISAAGAVVPETPLAPVGGKVRLEHLDGLRGLSATYVVVHHVWQFAITAPIVNPAPGWFRAFSIFKFGHLAVAVFIVLSGYCLMLPARRDGTLAGGLRGFALRRARRILPAYLAATLASLVTLLLVPGMRVATMSHWDIALPASPAAVATHLLLIHNLFRSFRWSLNPPLWSVALEWQIYGLFALVLLPAWRVAGKRAWMPLTIAIVVGVVPALLSTNYVQTHMLCLFVFGMIAATEKAPSSKRAWLGSTVLLFWGAIGGCCFYRPLFDWIPEVWLDLACGVATALLLSWLYEAVHHGRRALAVRLFSSPEAKWLGDCSYSIYLIHFPLVAISYFVARRLAVTRPGLFMLTAGLAIPAAVLIGRRWYTWFERPFLGTTVSTGPLALRVQERSASQSIN